MIKKHGSILFLCCIVSLTICMLCYPEAAYQGACRGIDTWATHLLPSLLPFFIAANLLMSLGFVRFLGVLLEPVMRPLFRLPGEAGFAVALGFTSGFPMGAVLTASLKEQKLCTADEAARLSAFTNNSSPLFLLTAVPVSMLEQPQLGPLLLAAHYTANLLIGVLLRFTAAPSPQVTNRHRSHLLSTAITEMRQYQAESNLSIGTILGQAIQKGISSIISIGGFVLFFSVLLSLLEASGLFAWLDSLFRMVLSVLHFSPQLSSALTAGLFEMTLGAQTAAECGADLLEQLMMISFILGWSGLSIQAQVCSILSPQKIPTGLYCLCRPLQGLLAALFIPVFVSCCPWILTITVSRPQLSPMPPSMPVFTFWCLLLLLSASFFMTLLQKLRHLFHQMKS